MEETPDSLLCRLCGIYTIKLTAIFSEEGEGMNLAEKINLYLPVKVAETDQFPLGCCSDCISLIFSWHNFVVKSAEVDQTLKSQRLIQEDDCKGDDFDKNLIETEEEPDINNEEEEDMPETKLSASLPAFCHEPLMLLTSDQKNTYILSETKPQARVKTQSQEEDYSEAMEDELEKKEVAGSSESAEDTSVAVEFVGGEETVPFIKDILGSFEKVDVYEEVNSNDKKGKKDRRKTTKLDYDMVNAAKVVVDDRIYYNCKICGKSLHSPYTYTWHMRIHTGERPFVCDLCGKQFRVSQGLVRHLRETHEGIKNFGCDLCGRMFATRRNVEEHRRIHTNERPYVCALCGKSFKQKASLFVHNRSHSDKFPYQCSYCHQGFRTRPPLLIHVTRHTGERPYPCDLCGRRFRIKYELKRHKLIHSEEKPYTCTDCGLSFRQKRYLRNHNKVNHNRNST